MLTVVPDHGARDNAARSGAGRPSLIDEPVRESARRMPAKALRAEVDAYAAQFADHRDEQGRRLVIRNGYHDSPMVNASAGAVEVTDTCPADEAPQEAAA